MSLQHIVCRFAHPIKTPFRGPLIRVPDKIPRSCAILNRFSFFPRVCSFKPLERVHSSYERLGESSPTHQTRVNPYNFATWFRPTRLKGTDDRRLLIRVPTPLYKKRLTETYGELLQAVLQEVGLSDTQLEFLLLGAGIPRTTL